MPALGTWWTHLWTFGPLRNPPESSGSFLVQYRKNCTFFRNPKCDFPYINLYLSTIPRLLVTSGISSGTPNNIRSPIHITHITLYRQRTLIVQTLRVRELCRHHQDTSPVNNQ